MVSRILFGTDVEAAIGTVHANFPILSAHIRSRAFSPVRLLRQWPTPGNREVLAAEKALYEVCDEIIARRGGEPADDLLGLLAAARGECAVDGTVIPAGSDVLVSPYVTHHHPGHREGPERCDPDRFIPEREAARHRYAWFPFGGPRSCIGQYFSMLESVFRLAALLRAFEVEAVDTEVSLSQGIILGAGGPVRIRLTRRFVPERRVQFGEVDAGDGAAADISAAHQRRTALLAGYSC